MIGDLHSLAFISWYEPARITADATAQLSGILLGKKPFGMTI